MGPDVLDSHVFAAGIQLEVAQAGAFTGNIHLIGGSIATVATAMILSRPSMANPRRVVWLLAAGIGLRPFPPSSRTGPTLWLCKLMFWIFIPAIYFYIGPCFGLLNNLAPCHMRNMFIAISLLVANILNLIVAPSIVGALSDWYAGPHGSDAASLRVAMLVLAPTGFWAAYHLWLASRTIIADQKRAIGYTKSWSP